MNKNVYYPTYTIDPESIYGSGIIRTNKCPTTNTTTSVITDSFPINKKLSPPVYRSGISVKPLDTNGRRVLKNPDYQSYKLDDFYYTSQQSNLNQIPIIEPTFKEKLAQKIKNVANNIVNDRNNNKNNKNNNKNNNKKKDNNINKKQKKNNKKRNNYSLKNINGKIDSNSNSKLDSDSDLDSDLDLDLDLDMDLDLKSNIDTPSVINYIDNNIKLANSNKSIDNYGRNKKMWINDHYLYALEPRYNSVVYPWRAYTWMYPVTPNTDNYYIDNINSSPSDPIIVSNDTTNKGNYQSIYLNTNMLKENFNSKDNFEQLEQLKPTNQQYKYIQNYLVYLLYYFLIECIQL